MAKQDGVKGWFTINGVHIPILDGENKNIAAKRFIKSTNSKKIVTAEKLLDDYYKNEMGYNDEMISLIKLSGVAYKKDLEGLKEITESKDAKDILQINDSNIKVNLHKQDVDIDKSLKKYKQSSTHINNLLNSTGDKFPSPDTIKDIENISSSLKQLPSYEGTVYRYDDRTTLPKVGETINIKSFYSTASNKEELDMIPYYTQRKTFYEIESKSGKKLKNNAQYKNENEVLFDLNSKFVVVSANTKNGKNYIKMKEK